MSFFPSLSGDHFQRYFRIVQEGLTVRRHADLLRWLQGEIQHYLPHEIMVAAWGDFGSGTIHHDIVSALPGVRTAHSQPASLSPLLRALYNRWVELGRMPVASGIRESGMDEPGMGESCLLRAGGALPCSFGRALRGMHSS